jgi:integrase
MLVKEWHRRQPAYARRLGTRGPETIRRTHDRTALFARMFGDQQIERLDLEALLLWFRAHPDKHRYVKTLLNDAVAAGIADRNPVLEIRLAQPRRVEHYLPNHEEIVRLADAMGPLRKFTLLAAFSGLRVSEVCNLRGEDVLPGEANTARLRVREGKGGKARVVVLFAPETVREAPQTGHLFLREHVDRRGWLVRREMVPWTGRHVAKRWDAARRRAGVPDSCRFHDLRRFHATWLLDRGASDLDVAVQLGHVDRNGAPNAELIRRVYGRPDPLAALGRLESLAV